jgi:hypothetical protein
LAEIEITLPTVQYGNVKIRATPEEFGLDSVGDAAALGVAAAVYLTTFTLGFKRGASIEVDIDDSMAHPGSGPYKAVTAPQGAEQSEVEQFLAEAEKAAQILADGLGGVTVMDEENVHPEESDPEETGKAPWDAKVEAKPKPWQTDGW